MKDQKKKMDTFGRVCVILFYCICLYL